MNISRDALLKIVRATRAAQKLADNIRHLTGNSPVDNMADSIDGQLADALNMMNGEKLGVADDFRDSRTYTCLYRSAMTDEEVADEFIRMAKENEPKMPKPNLISRVQFLDMVRRFGGYPDLNSTPEGEWPK